MRGEAAEKERKEKKKKAPKKAKKVVKALVDSALVKQFLYSLLTAPACYSALYRLYTCTAAAADHGG